MIGILFKNIDMAKNKTQITEQSVEEFIAQVPDQQKRLDITFGVKAGWIIPIYKKIARDFYYN
mgnify:CR=1 FL=1